MDNVIYLKTLLDIAFLGQIIRDYSDKDKNAILNSAEGYLNYARKLFLKHAKVISATADHILDGTLGLDRQIEEINKLLVDNKLDEYIFLKEGSQ